MKYLCSMFSFVLALVCIASALVVMGITIATQIPAILPFVFALAGLSLVCVVVSMEYLYHNSELQ